MDEQGTHRYRTIPAAAKETGIPESIIRAWIEQGVLKTHRNPNLADVEETIVDIIAIMGLTKSERPSGDDLPDD